MKRLKTFIGKKVHHITHKAKGYQLRSRQTGGYTDFELDAMPGGMRRGAYQYQTFERYWIHPKTNVEKPYLYN